ncbi:MAG: ElyC/SanA/YdcF family protein [Limisphaerales bacterium]
MTTNPTATSLRHQRWLKRLGALALVGVLLAGITWQTRERWLSGIAEAWVVNDPVERADAVMVLGGGAQFRSFEAVRFHHAGLAGKVLFPHIKPGADEPDTTTSRETSLIDRVLAHEHVPAEAREQIGHNITSTRDEVLALRVWADGVQARVILVPTDPFHTRRLKALIHSIFAGSTTRVLVTVVDPPGYRWQEWWRDEQGFLSFQNELLKSVQNAFK